MYNYFSLFGDRSDKENGTDDFVVHFKDVQSHDHVVDHVGIPPPPKVG